MSTVVVFGAGGRAGRRAVTEATTRGHQVTSVVRDPAKLADQGTVLAGDVTSADSVADTAKGADLAILAVYQSEVPSREFYATTAAAVLEGLARAGVRRLLVVGLALTLETAPGVRVLDQPGLPAPVRDLAEGHAALLDALRADQTGLDWTVFAPVTFIDDESPRTGRYRTGGSELLPADLFTESGPRLSYPDLAAALIDELENPQYQRSLVAIAPAHQT